MRIDVIDTVAGFDAVRDNWDQVYRDDPDAQHFLSWTWLRDFLGHRGRWFVLALRERERDAPYVAFLPLRLLTKLDEQSGLFYDEIVMGGNYSADYTGLIVMPGYEQKAIAGFAAYLKQQNWTHLRLEHFSGPPERRDKIIQALQGPLVMFRDNALASHDNIDNTICPVVFLPASWDDYLDQKMSSQTRQKLRRFLRKLDGDEGYRITMATPETIDRDLTILFDFWRTRWTERKGLERTERLINSTREMLMDCFKSGTLDVPVFWFGEQPLGALANIVDRPKKTILFYITGRDENWKTPSPGLMLHGYCIRRAIEDGFLFYDFLRGNEPYKYVFGADERRISYTLFRTRDGRNLGGVLHPRSVNYVYEQALEMYRKGEKGKAEIVFTQVLQSSPGHPGAEFGLANLLFERGKLTEALAAYQLLLERTAEPLPIALRLGDTQLALKLYEDAALTFHRIGEQAPHVVQARYKEGIALIAARRFTQAETVLAAIRDIHTDDPAAIPYTEFASVALGRLRQHIAALEADEQIPEGMMGLPGKRGGEKRRPRMH
ncbi:GNAT family N-acetyltransferase [Rhizobium viscosum]|uniref:CelD/BcsL family acetyltransferase involved in cellulose biosynthesis n=1 Tax=Rhizobium viscosum TaxID=1673 RepID=A0ABR9IN96_RHIVS|nr:GNAT family N-acetyltransferase [Rhizobium viscosum]MBE1504649.1 CelD/BcsL family acetyltransferase involved in cellulose biosynthesis [Rhizobium viscosum]